MRLADAYSCASRAMVENLLAADAEEGIDAFLPNANRKCRKQSKGYNVRNGWKADATKRLGVSNTPAE